MKNENEPLHQRLQRLREAQGLTAKAVARAIGVPESTYREWEYGKGMKLPPLQKISQVLAVSVTELLTGTQPDIQSQLKELEMIEQMVKELRLKIGSLN